MVFALRTSGFSSPGLALRISLRPSVSRRLIFAPTSCFCGLPVYAICEPLRSDCPNRVAYTPGTGEILRNPGRIATREYRIKPMAIPDSSSMSLAESSLEFSMFSAVVWRQSTISQRFVPNGLTANGELA